MPSNITTVLVSAGISALSGFVIGTFLGEPIKFYILRKLHIRVSKSEDDMLMDRLMSSMNNLIIEMQTDLKNNQSKREFVLMSKNWTYNAGTNVPLVYYFEDHDNLKDKVIILLNHGLVADIKFNKLDRYRMTEHFADLLQKCR